MGAAPEDAVVACPHYADVCYLRGLLLRDLDRPADAVTAFASARANGCVAPDLLFHLADSQLAAGDWLQAQVTLAEAVNEQNGEEIRIALTELQHRLNAASPREENAVGESPWR